MSDDIKVIGVGISRTGTSSLKKALEILGYNKCYHMDELIKNNHVKFWLEITNRLDDRIDFSSVFNNNKNLKYVSAVDMPCCLFYDKILMQYPNAKVILTLRDPEKWYQSCVETIFKTDIRSPYTSFGLKVMAFLGLPQKNFDILITKLFHIFLNGNNWNKENVIKCYNNHNNKVISTINSSKLLIFNISDGWIPLAKFLNKPIPNQPFPHLNDYNEMKRIIFIYNMIGYTIFICILFIPVIISVILKYLQII